LQLKINGERVYEITSNYLQQESFRTYPHLGIDLKMAVGEKLYSPVEGIVSKIVDYGSNNIGKGVFIKTPDNETVILGHLSKIDVKEGMAISLGDKLGLSGNTGNVIGNGHLHIGLKDATGQFINPSKVEQSLQEVAKGMTDNHLGILGKVVQKKSEGSLDKYGDFMDYIHELRTDGFFMATFGKSPTEFFFGWIGDALKTATEFILLNDEAFLIIPAIAIMFITFFIGKNKLTKWILPLWVIYFLSSVLTQATGLLEWLAE